MTIRAVLVGLPARRLEEIATFIGKGVPVLVHRALGDEEHLYEKALPLFERYYAEESGRASVPYPGAREGIRRMRELGLHLACVTNKPERFTRNLLERSGFVFDVLVCGDHVTRKKPDPEAVLLACERLGVAAREAVFIGDSQNDVAAARAAGCGVWCVPYGYNEGRAASSLACDRMVASLEEAARALGLNRSVRFFDEQFRRQARAADYALNPFEQQVLPHLAGDVLDLGCGLGNLSLAAARAGCRVTALDASPAGIADLQKRAGELGLPVAARVAELKDFAPAAQYDCVVAIGLLMFFDCATASRLLEAIQRAVRPGGLAAVNVLVEGTTYLGMFEPGAYCLFRRDELSERFAAWTVVLSRHDDYPAPGETLKRFHTLVVRRP